LVLPQGAEQLLLGEVLPVEVLPLQLAGPEQQHFLAFHEVAKLGRNLGEVVEQPVQAHHHPEHDNGVAQWHLGVKHGVAGNGAQADNDAQLEERELLHAAPPGDAQGRQQHEVGGHAAENYFQGVEGRVFARPPKALPVERRNGVGQKKDGHGG
jgi:hypothetical protein